MTHPEARRRPAVTFAVILVAATIFSLLQSEVGPALPRMMRDLHTNEAGISWVLMATLLSASVATPIVGRLGDMFGKRRMYVLTLLALSAGALVSALATSLWLMLLGRALQGVGYGVYPLSFGIVRDELPRARVAGAIGLLSSLIGVGGGLGVALAGPITDHLDYHYLFWLPLLLLAPVAVAARLAVPESPVRAAATVNYRAAALMAGGLVVALLGVSKAPAWGWGAARTLGLLAVGAAVLALWVAYEARAQEPLVDMRMMQIRGVWTTNLTAILLGFGMYSSFILLPQLVETPARAGYGFGSSVTQGGLFLVPLTAMMLVFGALTGRLEARFGSKPPLMAGAALSGLAYVLLALVHDRPWQVYVTSGVLGTGIGLAFAALVNAIIESVRPDQTGVATGMNAVMRTVGGAFGGAVTGSVIASSAGGRFPAEHGYTLAFLVAAGVAAAAVAAAGLAQPPRGRRTPVEAVSEAA